MEHFSGKWSILIWFPQCLTRIQASTQFAQPLPSTPGELASADVIWQHSGEPVQPPLIQSAKSLFSPSPNSSFLTLRTLHLAVNFEDGFYNVELVVIMDVETVKNSLLFWYWPSNQELMNTNRAAVLLCLLRALYQEICGIQAGKS